jgi:hypothetical protein
MKHIPPGTGLRSWRPSPFLSDTVSRYRLLAGHIGGRKAPTSVKLCHPTLVSREMPKPPFLA